METRLLSRPIIPPASFFDSRIPRFNLGSEERLNLSELKNDAGRTTRLFIFQRSSYLSVRLAFFDGLSFVEFFLAADYCDCHFDFSAFIIYRKRYYCQSFGFFFTAEARELFLGEKEPTISHWRVVFGRVVWLVWGYSRADKESFTASN